MNTPLEIFNATIMAIGFPSMIAGTIYVGKKLEKLDRIDRTVEVIKTNLKVVCDFLTQNDSGFNPSELLPYSPLRLSDEGFRLIRELGFDTVFANYKADFYACIDNENPKLKYDVEAAAVKSISLLGDREYMKFLKIFFYNHPKRNMSDTAPTLGVYIRDKYLNEHPEIVE